LKRNLVVTSVGQWAHRVLKNLCYNCKENCPLKKPRRRRRRRRRRRNDLSWGRGAGVHTTYITSYMC